MAWKFTRVIEVLGELAPVELAASWDNVGLLIRPTSEPREIERVFLTIDLTVEVLDEAIRAGAELIVAYHPPIFSGLKRLDVTRREARVVVTALTQGLFVYSPHTALDATPDGMGDWLARSLGPGSTRAIEPFSPTPTTSAALRQVAESGAVGMGRFVELETPCPLADVVPRLKAHLGLSALRIARAVGHDDQTLIRTLAVCPGAGGSVFEKVGAADLLLTGEMRHHDVLGRVARGTSVVLCDHTNTERGYLPLFAERLQGALPGIVVTVSTCDVDPLRIV